MFAYSNTMGSAVIINDKMLDDKIDGKVNDFKTNTDNTAAVAMTYDNTLYYIANGVVKIAENVYSYVFSNTGNGIAYIDQNRNLQLYRNGKTEKVDDGIYGSVAISPDGNCVGYTKATADLKCYVYFNGKSTEIATECEIVALADSGEYIYYMDIYTSELYFANLKNVRSRISTNAGKLYFALNKDYSQILFREDEKTYISTKGGKTKLLGDNMLPDMKEYKKNGAVVVFPVESLFDKLYISDSIDIKYVDSRGEVSTISESARSIKPLKNHKEVFFINSGSLYRAGIKENAKKELVADDVQDFYFSSNGEYIYYINEASELFGKKGSIERKISDDVGWMIITSKDIVMFLTQEGEMYSCSNIGVKRKIADNVALMMASDSSAYYFVLNVSKTGYDLYISNGDMNFSKMLEDIEPIYDYRLIWDIIW